jgi:GxxExxY protein
MEEAPERDPLSAAVIGCAIEVHRLLGPGLLESVYERCLCHELTLRGIAHRRQVELPLVYKDLQLERSLIVDILVAQELVLELKSVDAITALHEAQLLTHLKLGRFRKGLILNFNVKLLKDGLKRLVH